jgi:PAS domain S-box-containing protein
MTAARVLIVEDERVVARHIQTRLAHLGYDTVGITGSGEEAVRLAAELRPDLVLMDIRLDGPMDGVAAAQQIRDRSQVPVVYLTAYADDDTLRRARVTEPFGYVLKPFDERELRTAVEMALYKHQAERRLRDSERRYAVTLSSIGDGVIATDGTGRVTFLNPAAEALTGWPRDEAAGRPVAEVFRLADERTRAPAEDPVTKVLRDGAAVGLANHTLLLRRDGHAVPIDDSGAPIRDDSGALAGAVLVFHDVTERRRAEEELRHSRQRYETLVNSVDGIVWEADARTFHFTFVSRQAERILGHPPARWLAQPNFWQDHLHPEDRHHAVAVRQAATHDHRDYHLSYRMWAADGREVWLEDRVHVVAEGRDVVALRGVMVDVTQERRLEAQYLQAQKMEAVGRLAGGVAHDFNNLLTAVLGYSQLLLARLERDDPARELAGEIHRAGEQAAALTRRLLAFSRKQVLQLTVFSLNDVIAGMRKMLATLIGEDVEIHVQLDPALGLVRADPAQVEQVIVNLAVNARDAMPQGGRLELETANEDLVPGVAAGNPGLPPGPYVRLTVRDSGCGMDADTLGRIFEPFFTTKEVGKGTGLGLATAYGIVQQSGGRIAVESSPGRGATFHIYLPRLGDPVVAPRGSPAAPARWPGGSETVLLAEDDKAVRDFARALLADTGYRVLEAADGLDALRVCETHPGPIHLLLTDVVMPGMTGRTLADHLVALRPGLRVLYMSGYTDDAVLRRGVVEADTAFLAKPFRPEELARKVREVLDA